ncbi:MAG: methyltransferase domain-containing protein [Deltaproteobacteria bacterium]|nr:MAG: methyltransferase domain-containing protein [Deltaproteobacteria bacterium]
MTPPSTLPYDCPEAMAPPAGTSWAALLEQVPERAFVLDVGCATGSFAVALKRKGCRVTGVEINPAAAEVARTRCDDVHVGDIAQLLARGTFPAEAFDVVLTADVLEHLVDPWALVRELRRVLKPGGFLLASLPNVTHASVVLEMCRGRFPTQPEGLLDATHLRFFGEESALSLFTQGNYRAAIVARIRHDPRHTEFVTRLDTVPEAVLGFLDAANPNATTYQFIIRATPAEAELDEPAEPPAPAPATIQEGLAREAVELRAELGRYHEAAVERHQHIEQLHQQLSRKDADIVDLDRRVRRSADAIRERDVRLTAQEQAIAGLRTDRDRWADLQRRTRATITTVAPRAAVRVLYVTEGWDGSYRYRCKQAVEQLRRDGIAANVMHVDDPALQGALPSYSIIVLFRVQWSARLEALVTSARQQHATLVFEIDDLIFDPAFEALLPFLDDLPLAERFEYRERFVKLRQTFDACDYFIGSTPALARHATALGKEAFVHPNLVSPVYVRTARLLRRVSRLPIIAYVSGSNTHDRDLVSVGDVLAEILDARPNVRLFACGFVDLPPALRDLTDRIAWVPYQDWRVYAWALARCRVAIAPMSVVNDFTDGKSALKFFEAGVFGVPTVATPTEAFRAAITDRHDGFLAADTAEWREKLSVALDEERGREVGERARATVHARFTYAAQRGALAALLHPLVGRAPGPVPPRLSLDPVRRGARGHVPPRRWERARREFAFFRGAGFIGEQPPSPAAASPPPGNAITLTPLAPAPFDACLARIRRYGAGWLSEERDVVRELAGGAEGWDAWEPNDDLRGKASNGTVASGPDPWLVREGLAIAAAQFRYLIVRMRATTRALSAAAQLFWAVDDGPTFTEPDSVRWGVDADSASRTYVLDLRGTAWNFAGTVTALRLDPLDCRGSLEVEEVLLVADLAQLAPGDLRRPLADRYLRGVGIECGALQKGLPVPPAATVFYIDRLTPEQARLHYPELREHALVAPHVAADIHRLPIPDSAVAFCIGNHLLEHARDPIAALEEMLRVVRPGGLVYVSVPDVGNPLDRRRPVTPFEHVLAHHDGTLDRAADDLLHFEEYTASAHTELDDAARADLVARFVEQDYSIHFHTFDEAAFHRLIAHVGASIVEFARNAGPEFDEYVAVLRKRDVAAHQTTLAPAEGVDVIVPIHNAREDTVRCVQAVRRHARGDWRLILVDDASTDPALVAWLDGVAAEDLRVQLLRNETNRGFVASANRGMRHAAGRDVLLLNSDTAVTEGFLERLHAAAYDGQPSIVSPLSNNATICSVPAWCKPNPIPAGFTLDGFASLVAEGSLQLRPDLVSAHGFCMYVPAAVLARVGLFDEQYFGRGFGEENDFCERAVALGFRVRLADDVFVYHRGSASFGDDTSDGLKRVNYQTLERLHPTYFPRVAAFIQRNPLAAVHENVRLAMRRGAAAPGGTLLALLHASFDEPGGGTEHHVRDLLQALRLPRAVVAVPEADGLHLTEILDGRLDEALRYRLPLAEPPSRFLWERPDVEEAIRTIVRLFGVRAVHLHQLCNWPIRIWRTFAALRIPFAATFQDFYCVCPNVNLYDIEDDRLCCAAEDGARPDPATCMRHLFAHFGLREPDDPLEFVTRHRAEFGDLLRAADRVIFPSFATRDLVGRFHDLDRVRSVVMPHGYLEPSHRVERRDRRRTLNVALLGQVAYAIKGARSYPPLLERTRHLPIVWHVFGGTDAFGYGDTLRQLGLGSRLVLHGWYRREDIFEQLAAAAIDLVVFLPPWPETFSYALSEALGAGIPVIVSDQGALPERVRADGVGVVVRSVDEAVAALERFANDRAALEALQAAAARFRHRTVREMADEYRPMYEEMLARGPVPASVTLHDRRQLFAAHRAVAAPRSVSQAQGAVLPHYHRRWYPYYLRLARLVPTRLRKWAREQVARRWWRTVRRYDFANGAVKPNDGLEFLGGRRHRAAFRVLHGDPHFVVDTDPFSTRNVRVIRFEMRYEVRGPLFAQLYWSHRTDESFSEAKSIRIPLNGQDGRWHEYTVFVDQSEQRGLWDAEAEIHHLRFDPVNAPGTIELRALRLCAVGDAVHAA